MLNIDEYKTALKRGEKELSVSNQNNAFPYLPILDDLIAGVNISKRVNLGLVTIPLNQVVGTVNANRSNAFSSGFMPLLEPGTEFASKWCTLYDSMVEEGMRDPIIAFEYMNKYYVREGNKRVSVSKYMNMVEIESTVTRIIPAKSDDPEVMLYYEYLDFYEKSSINYIYFSKPGYFKKFCELVAPDMEVWDDDTKMDVHAIFSRFSKVYGESVTGLSTSDAFFDYVKLLGFNDIKEKNSAQIADDIKKIRDELELAAKQKPVAISTHPSDSKANLFGKMFAPKRLKIAFIYMKDVDHSAWCYAHELGRQYVEDVVFPNEIDTNAFYNVTGDNIEQTLEELCHSGYDIIFDTSPQHNAACAKVAVLHPEVRILNCSLNASTKHMRTYYLRTYESKYLLGMLAGALTETDKLTYVADYPVYGSVASINAFAIGAKTVNPKAEVFLCWTSAKNSDPNREIRANGCDIVSDLDWSSPRHLTRRFGLYRNSPDGPINIAAPLWDWGKLYEEIITSVKNGTFKVEQDEIGTRSISYWWGISSGAVDIVYSNKIPDLTLSLMKHMKNQMEQMDFNPFSGKLNFKGQDTVDYGEGMSLNELISMKTLYENVHGFIPGVDDVVDELVDLTKLQGVIEPE